MLLRKKTLEELRKIINGDETADYRSGPMLVSFFNELGFQDTYGQGFLSRWAYTDDKLQMINGTPELDKCIRMAFAVEDYIGRIEYLDKQIDYFNQYLAFDKWQVIRNNDEITFKRLDKVVVDVHTDKKEDASEDEFLKKSFAVDINSLGLVSGLSEIIKQRLTETELCVRSDAPLAAIFLIGSILEGILLNTASTYPKAFNQAQNAPKDKSTGQVRKFHDWTLNNYIDVAAEIGILKHDVQKFSHVVRDFRNYIHPYSQMASRFQPDKQTTMICFQVLKAAISQISDYKKANP